VGVWPPLVGFAISWSPAGLLEEVNSLRFRRCG
jgi:hypothetical protein